MRVFVFIESDARRAGRVSGVSFSVREKGLESFQSESHSELPGTLSSCVSGLQNGGESLHLLELFL